jgi:cell division septum initiation protein DivIVA
MTRNRLVGLLATALLLVVLGVLASCEAFDAATGDVTKPVDPAAPVTQPVVSPQVLELQQAIAQGEQSLAEMGQAIAEAQAQAASDPKVAANLGKLQALYAQVYAQVVKWRGVLDATIAAQQATAGQPADKVIVGAGKPFVDALPFPWNLYGSLILNGAGLIGLAIQTARQRKSDATAKSEKAAKEQVQATAENIVWSIEKARDNPEFDAALLKVVPVLNERQTDAAKALVQRVTD